MKIVSIPTATSTASFTFAIGTGAMLGPQQTTAPDASRAHPGASSVPTAICTASVTFGTLIGVVWSMGPVGDGPSPKQPLFASPTHSTLPS